MRQHPYVYSFLASLLPRAVRLLTFQVLLVAEDIGDAERLGVLLSGPEAPRHPWLLPAAPAEAWRAAGFRNVGPCHHASPDSRPLPHPRLRRRCPPASEGAGS